MIDDCCKVKTTSFSELQEQIISNISKWDVSNVQYIDSMFQNSKFNEDISKWNVKDKSVLY